MIILIGLIISLIFAFIIHKVKQYNFFTIWLTIVVAMLSVFVTICVTFMLLENGITNQVMLYVVSAIFCWMSVYVMWKGRM